MAADHLGDLLLVPRAQRGEWTATAPELALRARHPVERTGFALIVGGAIGNIIDRLRQGAVTDFLDVFWQDWHWPTFNVADMAITLGAACLLASSLPQRRRKEPVRDQG